MFQIGTFSKIAQVSGRLLRYYDEIGLLSPEATDPETGYRYYSARQLPRLNRILALKELGLSLEQISRLLNQNITVGEIRGMMTLRKAQIEQTVQLEMARLRAVEIRLEQIDTHGQMQEPDVVLKTVPAQSFLAMRTLLHSIGELRRIERLISTVVPTKVGHQSLDHVAIVIHSSVFDPEALDVEVGYLLSGKAPESVSLSEEYLLTRRVLPAIETMATLVHIGENSDISRTYGALGTWIEQQGWQISGAGRHTLMQLAATDEEGEAVIEIQLPVSRQLSPGFSSPGE